MLDIDKQLPQRARDRKTDARRRGADPDVAAGGNPRAAAGAGARDGRNRRTRTFSKVPSTRSIRSSYSSASSAVLKARTARCRYPMRRFIARTGQDHRLDRAVAVDGLADRRHLLVHRKGQRVARLRTVERQPGDTVLDGIDQVFGLATGAFIAASPFLFRSNGYQGDGGLRHRDDVASLEHFHRRQHAAAMVLGETIPPDSVPIIIRSFGSGRYWPIRTPCP